MDVKTLIWCESCTEAIQILGLDMRLTASQYFVYMLTETVAVGRVLQVPWFPFTATWWARLRCQANGSAHRSVFHGKNNFHPLSARAGFSRTAYWSRADNWSVHSGDVRRSGGRNTRKCTRCRSKEAISSAVQVWQCVSESVSVLTGQEYCARKYLYHRHSRYSVGRETASRPRVCCHSCTLFSRIVVNRCR